MVCSRWRWLFALTLCVSVTGWVHADEILLRNGRRISGKAHKRPGGWEIRTDSGIVSFIPGDQVLEVQIGPTALEAYQERAVEIAPDDVTARLALAAWCRDQGLDAQATMEYEAVVEVDPDHVEAHRALDHVRHEGEWVTRAAYMESLGFVRHKGRWVTEEEADKVADKAQARRLASHARSLIRRASALITSKQRETARGELAALGTEVVIKPLIDTLDASDSYSRMFAAQRLALRGDARAVRPLVRTAVRDRYNTVRIAALHSLEGLGHPDTVVPLASHLYARNTYHRLHAVQAMSVFPDRRGVYYLIRKLRHETGGFGRVHVAFTTQRAFIRDWELSAGGTGLAIAEVADPVVDIFQEGVVLDVKIRRVEWESTVAVLRGLTGQKFGGDVGAWSRWWRENGSTFALRDPAEGDDEESGG